MSIRWGDGEEERLEVKENPSYAEYLTKDGRSYYWNTVTGMTQWHRPHGNYVIPHEFTTQSNELFVFYLPSEWTDDDLREHFARFGNIINAKVALDRDTGKSKGFAFVTYEDSVSAANAVQAMNGFQVLNKRLKVQFKKNNE